ncbi:GNAT family N-acetyltransferase [Mesonia ostreae]|uniref:GNAT family N-acetyltransferase n=1 Tax=Mesonia ostreae TaxID=861110 RepID=A0ABU2KLJ3_9FLAO|nr:GNAT family N-acetyltransferase [Mesonia ostreae]MDT0295564.1 GNAT family N-acetyltransferase [Mesonia ostreae]
MEHLKIRPIQKADNPFVAEMIRAVLIENNAPKTGTAYEDKNLDSLYETYQDEASAYFVLTDGDKIYGAAGIASLEGSSAICELQKMYFLHEVRGKGLGMQMMKKCLSFAQAAKYKKCYLETLPSMLAAQKLYQKSGFKYVDKRLGNTGHFSCTTWMLKEL